MDILPTDAAGAPARWLLIFRRRSDLRWVNWLVPGRFKHVCAIAAVPECDVWVFYNVGFGRTSIFMARGAGARRMMVEWTRDSEVLVMEPHPAGSWFPAFCCTTAIRQLIGLPGWCFAPTALYRDCLRHGARIVQWERAEQ